MSRPKVTDTLSEEQIQKIVDNYVIKHQGLQAAGREYNLSQYQMESLLSELGITKRTYVEAKQLTRKYTCDDNYFKHQTSNMAYILGFIAADGNIAKKENQISINLNAIDIEILRKIQEETKVSRPVSEYIKNSTGQHLCKFSNFSHEWKQDLAVYGIHPAKTFTLEPPLRLDSKYAIDYIRGYFDADGSITMTQYNCLFDIAGASKKVMDWIHATLVNQYGVFNKNGVVVEHLKDSSTIMYHVRYGAKSTLNRLYRLMYFTDSTLFLQRKKEKFASLLGIPRDFDSSVEE